MHSRSPQVGLLSSVCQVSILSLARRFCAYAQVAQARLTMGKTLLSAQGIAYCSMQYAWKQLPAIPKGVNSAAGDLATATSSESPGQARVRAAVAASAAAEQSLQGRSSLTRNQSPAPLAASQQKVCVRCHPLHPTPTPTPERNAAPLLPSADAVSLSQAVSDTPKTVWRAAELFRCS